MLAESVALTHQLHAKRQYLSASPLQPAATAVIVRVREGKPMVTDGPFIETREQIAGYFLIDAKDLNEAIRNRRPGSRRAHRHRRSAALAGDFRLARRTIGDLMQKITPCLWFDNNAEEAVNHYLAIFKNSKIGKVLRCGESGPGPKGSILTIAFELEGQEFIALNGGPIFKFTEAISLSVDCKTQQKSMTCGRNCPTAVKRASVVGSKINSDCRGKWFRPRWSRCCKTKMRINRRESWRR